MILFAKVPSGKIVRATIGKDGSTIGDLKELLCSQNRSVLGSVPGVFELHSRGRVLEDSSSLSSLQVESQQMFIVRARQEVSHVSVANGMEPSRSQHVSSSSDKMSDWLHHPLSGGSGRSEGGSEFSDHSEPIQAVAIDLLGSIEIVMRSVHDMLLDLVDRILHSPMHLPHLADFRSEERMEALEKRIRTLEEKNEKLSSQLAYERKQQQIQAANNAVVLNRDLPDVEELYARVSSLEDKVRSEAKKSASRDAAQSQYRDSMDSMVAGRAEASIVMAAIHTEIKAVKQGAAAALEKLGKLDQLESIVFESKEQLQASDPLDCSLPYSLLLCVKPSLCF